jgi:hypothetical protein
MGRHDRDAFADLVAVKVGISKPLVRKWLEIKNPTVKNFTSGLENADSLAHIRAEIVGIAGLSASKPCQRTN